MTQRMNDLDPSEENQDGYGVVESRLGEAEKFEVGVFHSVGQETVQLIVHHYIAVNTEGNATNSNL